ncbi:protein of unknown function [Thiomonas sp. X19]|uniref:type II toxin-antitoxin system RelE/ParE family toxin n=1 Tax=Thiomonas sp. X19 TaxID=1050370 RepID=UPI000B66860C|nr:type II toxin-antitoxin system RelE/ParE family toxin [Thiomonas sp. X19]SCC95931.1 protein of unknown function [Thiomonas sp. X19]
MAVTAAAANPYLYRAGRIPGTRELVAHPNYIVVYQVTERLEVLNVLQPDNTTRVDRNCSENETGRSQRCHPDKHRPPPNCC